MNNYKRAIELSKKLKKYTELECNSLQEACDGLRCIAEYPDYLSDEFYLALVEELEYHLQRYEEGSEIVEREETFTRTVSELVWNDE